MPNTPDSWAPGSRITLCNVPWDSGYKDVVEWWGPRHPLGLNRDDYFNNLYEHGLTIKLLDSAYMPIGTAVQVAVPYETAYQYNYAVVRNPATPVDGSKEQTFYYFITSMSRPNPSSTLCTLQLDVWTTYAPSVVYGTAYVERGHIAMANKPALVDGGKNIPQSLNTYLTQSEGLDTGERFYTYKSTAYTLQQLSDTSLKAESDWVIIVSTVSLTDDPGTIDAPSLKTADGTYFDGLFSGSNVYVIPKSKLHDLLKSMQDYSWVSQCIISISTVPYCFIPSDRLVYGGTYFKDPDGAQIPIATITDDKPLTWNSAHPFMSVPGYISINGVAKGGWDGVEAYRDLRKLWTYPYSVIELTASASGQSVFLKPQALADNTTYLKAMTCALVPFAQAAVFPERYGTFTSGNVTVVCSTMSEDQGTMIRHVPYGDFLDVALWFDDFPQFSVVNNSYIAYMASTANTRANQYSSAEWSLQSANMSNANSYANTMASTNLSYQNAQLQMDNTRANNKIVNTQKLIGTGVQAVGNIGSLAASAAKFDVAGTASAGVSLVTNTAMNLMDYSFGKQIQENNLNTAAILASNNYDLASSTADRNYALASQIAQGNYDNQVSSIDAGYQDAALKQPSSSGNVGGNGFRYANGLLTEYTISYKRISNNAISRIGDYFYRFGYAINRFIKIPYTLVYNKHYSYWKAHQVGIEECKANETYKDAIRGIFENGVTVWRVPSEIGTILPVENTVDPERELIYYE